MNSESYHAPPLVHLTPFEKYARVILLPLLFSTCAWWIALRAAPILPQFPHMTLWKHSASSSSYDKNLIPDTLHDAFKLGEISFKMKNFPSKDDTSKLLEEANDILNKDNYNLTVEDLTVGKLDTAIEEHCKRHVKYKIFREVFSFVGILSVISIVGILATLWPTLKFIYEVLHLDQLWHKLISISAWILKVIEPLVNFLSFFVPLVMVDQSLYFPMEGTRSQINILAAGFAIMAFFYQIWKSQGTAFDLTDEKYFTTIAFVWGFTFLVPLALIGTSQFLGFFAVGSIFGALGFVAFPTPIGWASGFQDEVSMEKCMYTSMVVISFSVMSKLSSLSPRSRSIMEIFQFGMSVFGMLVFGLAGLIKSSRASDDGHYFGGATNPTAFIYPISWLVLGFVGSLISYASLTNTAITFVCLWMTQFYWRIAGFTSVSTFFFSCMLFYVTLQLKMQKDFLWSVLQV